MENVVRIDEIPSVVERTLLGIRQGVAQARAEGLMAELPGSVDFQMVVIDKWQELETEGGQTSESSEEQGGGTVVKTTGKDNSETKRTAKENRAGSETSKATTDRTSNERRQTDGNDQKSATETGSSNAQTDKKGSATKQDNNAHNQKSETFNTYEDV